jgi:hypothetical protein
VLRRRCVVLSALAWQDEDRVAGVDDDAIGDA